jgi:type IV pilus assembly protein PilA
VDFVREEQRLREGKPMICSMCGAENPIKGRFCNDCGALLQGQRGAPLQPHDFAPANAPYTGPGGTSGKAIGSLVCGFVVVFFPLSIVAIILGHWALAEIRRSGGRLTGRGIAIAGLILGYSGVTLVPLLIIGSVAIPNMRRYQMRTNQSIAVRSLRKIQFAEIEFQDSYANGFSPDLLALAGDGSGERACSHAALIDEQLASGHSEGYRLTYVARGPAVFQPGAGARGCSRSGSGAFEIHAEPIKRGSTGELSFFTDQTGIIRYNSKGPATAKSPAYRVRLQ